MYLAPDQHRSEDDLKSVEEVVSDDDDGRSARSPALARTDCLDGRRRGAQEPCQPYHIKYS